MNERNWLYRDNTGKHHRVGLMHNPQNGNLMIHCDGDVLFVDFKVFGDYEYTFFIEEELLKINIKKGTNSHLTYFFQEDTKTDTPANREQKKSSKQNFWKASMLIALFALFMVGLFYLLGYKQRKQLADEGIAGIAKIRLLNSDADQATMYYEFGQSIVLGGTLQRSPTGILLCENGLPLKHGDEFHARYVPNNPNNHIVYFDKPSEQQVEKYKIMAAQKHQYLNIQKNAAEIACEVDAAYVLNDLNGLANIFFQNIPFTKNERHHTDAYLKMKRDHAFAQAYHACIENK